MRTKTVYVVLYQTRSEDTPEFLDVYGSREEARSKVYSLRSDGRHHWAYLVEQDVTWE